MLVTTGVVFGSIASLVTIVPYSIARTDSAVPDTGLASWLGVVAVAVTLALASSLGTARRTIREPAVEAAAVAVG